MTVVSTPDDDERAVPMSTSGPHTSPRDGSCPRRPRRVRLLALVTIAALLVLSACSDADDSASSGDEESSATAPTSEGGGTDGEADADRAEEGGDQESSADAGAPSSTPAEAPATPVALTPADFGRSIVYTATVELQAADVNAATAQAQQAVAALGGVVFGQQSTSSPQPRTVLVFKVGPDQFQAALDALGTIGDVVHRDVTADDVTERVVDLQSQISSAEVSVARLRDLLDAASNLDEIAALEAQLLQRETTLEQLRGQLRTLQDQVALSTITLTISQPAATPVLAVAATAYAGIDDGTRCPGADELTLDEGDDATMCLTVENAGNVALSDIEVRDHRLGVDPEDVTLVGFEEGDVLEPGDEVVAWATFVADPDVRPAPDVSAVPVDESGTLLRVAVQSEVTPIEMTVEPDESLPGFVDGLTTATGVLGIVVGILVVLLGLAVPFLVIGVPLAAAAIWWRRRQDTSDTPPAPAAS
jgi:Domain of unknown function (DUF4349)